MRGIGRWLRGRRFALGAAVWIGLVGISAAQVPTIGREQVELLRSMSPAEQQALIRQLEGQLPPAQRDAIVRALRGSGTIDQLDQPAQAALSAALRQASPVGEADVEEDEEPQLAPRDTVVLRFSTHGDADPLTTTELQEQDDFLERLARSNPYELDSLGQLLLPGVAPIRLAGLNVEDATIRVEAEPALRDFSVELTLLPLDPVGTEALRPFGYEMFERRRTESTRADLPLPQGYIMGPGDSLTVQLFGNQNAEYFLPVNRDGTINFPEIGPVTVSGLTFDEARSVIAERVAEQMIGVTANVTPGQVRSIGVLVLGDVKNPGQYSVSGFATVADALFASGGVTEVGSLRNIELVRNDETIATLDLYDLLLNGVANASLLRLQSNDSIVVRPIQATVSVDGEVRRPAIYELKNEETLDAIIALAGGLKPTANRSNVRLERVVPARGTTVEEVDLTTAGASTRLRDGDVVHVLANLSDIQNSIRLSGNVFEAGLYQWTDGMRLGDLLYDPTLVKPRSDLRYVLIRRELVPNVRTTVLSSDLDAVWSNRSEAENVLLQARDTIYVFDIEAGRRHVIDPLLEELGRQAAPGSPVPVVRVDGQTRIPGRYPLEPGMRITDLLRAGGGMSEAAYLMSAELTRYEVVNGESREIELVTVDLAAALRGEPNADLQLRPYDFLNVREVPGRVQESVTLRGEVKFPGTYPIRPGERLSNVIARAGGLTELAFAEGSVFTRVERRQRERQELDALATRIERELSAMSVADVNASQAVTAGQSLISSLRSTTATGRVVIQLSAIIAGSADADVLLKDGDQLIVPPQAQEIAVLGEIQYTTSHLFERGLTRDDYIAKSGGLTQRADEKRIYVVRASGEVVADQGQRWFRRSSGTAMRPGDTIVVPLQVEQQLGRWTQITQIIYNLAIAAAAVNSF